VSVTALISNHNQQSAARPGLESVVVVAPVVVAVWSAANKSVPAAPIVPLSSILNATDVAAVT